LLLIQTIFTPSKTDLTNGLKGDVKNIDIVNCETELNYTV